MLKSLIRLFAWFCRFLIGIENYGFWSAVTVFIVARYSNRERRIKIKKLDRYFSFRGREDKGVLSHFYEPGYRILDTQDYPVRTIIDAGANIGDEVFRFRYFHPEAKIIAIEPESSNYELLQRNCEDDPNVLTLKKGLWSKDCFLKVVPETKKEACRVIEADIQDSDYDVEGISLSTLVAQFDLKSIDILKIDIEGSEYFVFSENYRDWIDLVKVFIIEAPDNDRPGSVSQIFKAIDKKKFNVYLHGENLVIIRADLPWTLTSDMFYQK